MEKSKDSAAFPAIVEVTASIQIDSNYVMQGHFNKIVLSRAKEVSDEVSRVEAHGNQKVFLQLWSVLYEWKAGGPMLEVSSAAQVWWQVNLVFNNAISPNRSERKIDEFERSKTHLLTFQLSKL